MDKTQQRQRRREKSVLDEKYNISGLPSDAKSAVEQAREEKDVDKDCDSVLDGPACIDGVPENKKERH